MGASTNKGAKTMVTATPATPAGVIFDKIQAINGVATFTATENPEDTANGDTSFSGSIGDGQIIFGRFSVINVSAGTIRAYLASS